MGFLGLSARCIVNCQPVFVERKMSGTDVPPCEFLYSFITLHGISYKQNIIFPDSATVGFELKHIVMLCCFFGVVCLFFTGFRPSS